MAEPEKVLELDDKLYQFLIEKNKQISITPNFELDCLISKEKAQCLRFIDRKHTKGNNEIGWLEPERINYARRRGNEGFNTSFKIAINNYVRTLKLPPELINQILGKGYVTTFYRFITSGPAKELFELDLDESGELRFGNKDFPEILKVLIYNLLKKSDFEGNKIDTRVYNKKPEIETFLKSLKPENSIRVDEDIQKNTHSNLFGGKDLSIISDKQSRKTPKTTKTEILFGRILELKKGKVNDLYCTISNIYRQNEHDETLLSVVGMSLRLLVEISARVYFEGTENGNKDKLYDTFLRKAKKEMKLSNIDKNFLTLTEGWLENDTNIEALLGKYAHGNIISTESDIMACSKIIGDVLMFYFKK